MLRAAAAAGFVVLDLFDVYGPETGHDSLRVAEWDKHPNAAGHAMIAERLLDELRRRPALLEPAPSADGAGGAGGAGITTIAGPVPGRATP
jgi:hypothetical protein